jgi:hypothetical protein
MDVSIITIRQLFGQERQLVVPLYQRPYVWRRDTQWEPLWTDIRALSERLLEGRSTRAHFMGAVVLEHVPLPTGTLENRLVIDGQQRMTTIQMLLEAFHDYCDLLGAEKQMNAVKRLVRNEDPMADGPLDVYKLWPTNVDREHFVSIIEAKGPDELKAKYKKPNAKELGHPILDGYMYFFEQIKSWIEELGSRADEGLDVFVSVIRDQIKLVVIDVNNQDDAQLIFETLNARGTPLLPSDLVKNHLFHRAEIEKEDLDKLYNEYWVPFENEQSYWREEIGRGHARRARIDLFLQHYLTLCTRDEASVGHLYALFRTHSSNPSSGNAKQQLATLRQYAIIFQSFDRLPETSPFACFFRRLEAMEVGTPYPFLMLMLAKFDNDAPELIQVTGYIESFLVRRMVCQLNTRGYSRFFIDLLSTLDGDLKGLPERVRAVLVQSDAEVSRWPDDNEFRESWLSSPLYKGLMRSRMRMILEALNDSMQSAFGENLILRDKLTIEHMMPQEWKENWPLPPEATNKDHENRNRLIHTIGNLTLISGKLNPSISNGCWEVKLEGIASHSRLNLNANLGQNWPIWNEENITIRGENLLAKALNIWGRPVTDQSI